MRFAALLCFLIAEPATAFVKCKTADGKLLFVDVAPPGCAVEGAYQNTDAAVPIPSPTRWAPRPKPTRNAAEAGEEIIRRREIEREEASRKERRGPYGPDPLDRHLRCKWGNMKDALVGIPTRECPDP
jgi:hypothetical protein